MENFRTTLAGFDIVLSQNGPDDFTVTYGRQIRANLDYVRASAELGACIMHALACDGKLDNREVSE
jgi:hypothetical protein